MIAFHTLIVLLHLSTTSYNALHALHASQSLEFGSTFPLEKYFSPNLVTQDYVFPMHGFSCLLPLTIHVFHFKM